MSNKPEEELSARAVEDTNILEEDPVDDMADDIAQEDREQGKEEKPAPAEKTRPTV